jgi:hypothetical protein
MMKLRSAPLLTACFFLVLSMFCTSCDTEEAPDCFQTSGERIEKKVELPLFSEIIVYDDIDLIITQGAEQEVVISTGKNLISEISAGVQEGRLILKNENDCNLFREYGLTRIYVTVPDLTWLQNAGNRTIKSKGALHFPKIWLRSLNQEETKGVYTVGDFELDLFSENIRITGDDFSNFFLSGRAEYLKIFLAAGDGRVEAQHLKAETVEVQHRGTNKVIINPQQILKGEIRSTGDVISVNRPPVVEVQEYYLGKLIFQ